jgi:alpha-galactosidase
MLAEIIRQMKDVCPDAWLMNFVNPMSMLCTYFARYTQTKWMGFCHQVHGSFGVVAEMLGMNPGDLQVVTAGINHMNFLLDIRKKSDSRSYKDEFFQAVKNNTYWKKLHKNVPEQVFTLEFLNTFGIYPVGYDGHIQEYMPFFYNKKEWEELGYESSYNHLVRFKEELKKKKKVTGTIQDVEVWRQVGKDIFPFPKDQTDLYYKETPVEVIESLLTTKPLYLDAMVTSNNGCVANLPFDAIVDIPAIIVGGQVRGISVGELPFFAAELCHRQIAIHELIARAAAEGSRQHFLEALCLDPFVRNLRIAKKIMEDYLAEYKEYLPKFN